MTTNNIHALFTRVVDDLILSSRNDTKLVESIRWIDMQSQKNGISFYEMAYIITDKHMTKKRAQEWLKTKEFLCF
ncbi:hypothetical protein BH18THE2_BH18THE2_30840 [soil metagenome]